MEPRPTKLELAAGGAMLAFLLGVPLALGWLLAFGDAPGHEDANRAFEIICSVAGALWGVWLFLVRKEAVAYALLVIQQQRFGLFLAMGGVMLALLAKVGFVSIADGRVVYGAFALVALFLSVLMGWGVMFYGYLHDKRNPKNAQSDPDPSE